ncbi:MAG TPA: M1 family aminopeptidase, partial [Candidatus Manganitrophaceae bacterium]|nr:M1 family aminopeptidase [Candidatus Manganitrophaceae bacterium]
MTRRKRFMIAGLAAFAAALLAAAPLRAAAPPSPIHHDLQVTLFPEIHRLEVEDTVTLSQPLLAEQGGIVFFLHGKLYPESMTPGVKLTEEKGRPTPLLFDSDPSAAALPVEQYRVALSGEVRTFKIKYSGRLDHSLEEGGEKYGGGMDETPGSISSDGIFLAASSFWYPLFPGQLVSFTLEVHLPEGWDGVSQGKRTAHLQRRGGALVRWESPEPQDEIYLAGNRYTEYSRPAGPVTTMAFLRKPDKELAEKYLTATGQYLEMYQKLIGPYPYTKFALVENFWESGYGMPSFTLLGPQIIRFPFILHSSYPHEILHNWWGNGVFVDFQSGNWSEGLTAYLADHLISEQRGEGAAARRAVLQKYTDYVSEGKDFPLTGFRSRHSAATEAVGYGKTLMFFHMLRRELGDDLFVRSLQAFYRENKFRVAGFADLEQAFSKTSGRDLKAEFKRWTTEPGAPMLRLNEPQVKADGEG